MYWCIKVLFGDEISKIIFIKIYDINSLLSEIKEKCENYVDVTMSWIRPSDIEKQPKKKWSKSGEKIKNKDTN